MTEPTRLLACRRCGGNLPANASFCPSCGVRVTLYQVQRHPLGLEPAQLFGGLTAMACVLAAVLFVAGAWIAGLLMVIVAVVLVSLLVAAIRHEPHSQGAFVVVRATDRAASLARLTAVAAREWTRGAMELVSTRRPLEEAVVRDARRGIERERVGTQPTTVLPGAGPRAPGRVSWPLAGAPSTGRRRRGRSPLSREPRQANGALPLERQSADRPGTRSAGSATTPPARA